MKNVTETISTLDEKLRHPLINAATEASIDKLND